jgi:hypothetical protein
MSDDALLDAIARRTGTDLADRHGGDRQALAEAIARLARLALDAGLACYQAEQQPPMTHEPPGGAERRRFPKPLLSRRTSMRKPLEIRLPFLILAVAVLLGLAGYHGLHAITDLAATPAAPGPGEAAKQDPAFTPEDPEWPVLLKPFVGRWVSGLDPDALSLELNEQGEGKLVIRRIQAGCIASDTLRVIMLRKQALFFDVTRTASSAPPRTLTDSYMLVGRPTGFTLYLTPLAGPSLVPLAALIPPGAATLLAE